MSELISEPDSTVGENKKIKNFGFRFGGENFVRFIFFYNNTKSS
jgi:hypothetical protein